MEAMYQDYQSLTTTILVNIFGLLLVALVKDLNLIKFGIVLALFIQGIILLLLLAMTITVNQVQFIFLILAHISMTDCGTEQDVQEVVFAVMTPLNLGSIIS